MTGTSEAFARTFSFEVLALHDDRWMIDGWLDDEPAARARARALMARGQVEGVRVVRHRRSPNGTEVATEILNERRGDPRGEAIALAGDPASAPPCASLDDFTGLESRMAIGGLLRHFLTREAITPSELLFGWRYLKRLDDAGPLLAAAINAVAQAQAAGGDPAQRRKALQQLVAKAMARARRLHEQRSSLPVLAKVGPAEANRVLRARVPEPAHDETFLLLLADHLAGHSLPAKLEVLFALLARCDDQRPRRLIEGVIADCLGFTEVIKELIPAQRHSGGTLLVVANLLAGRLTKHAVANNPALAALSLLIEGGAAPCCRTVLLDRVGRSLTGSKPLAGNEPDAEVAVLDDLALALRLADGQWLGGAAMPAALDARRLRLRQDRLRRMGMDSAADALPARSYK